MNTLLDFYSKLLTEKQQSICKLYYRYDLSLKEIADEVNVSRSAVYDTVNRCDKDLERYESILHMAKKQQMRLAMYDSIDEINTNDTIQEIVSKCRQLEFEDDI